MRHSAGKTNKIFGGLLERREGWAPTRKGLAFGFLALLGISAAILWNLYAFLAHTERVQAQTLVVDGGMPTQIFRLVAKEYSRQNYRTVLVVRGSYTPGPLTIEQPSDDYIAEILSRHGIPRERIKAIVFSSFKRDQTFYSALAVRDWCRQEHFDPGPFNIATSGSRSRRTLLIFKRVMGKNRQIGVIGLEDPAFDARHWWRSSEGVREVFFEGIAYAFTLLFRQSEHQPA